MRRSGRAQSTTPGSRSCTRTGWDRCSISCRTTWASASRSINGGWTCSKTGRARAYAPYFDIDWQPLKSDLHDKVLLPILGDQYGRVLERGELQVHFEAGAFYLSLLRPRIPDRAGHLPAHSRDRARKTCADYKEEDFYAEFQSILTALEYLPRRTETDPERIAERTREKGNHQATAGTALPGSAASAGGDREGAGANQRHAGRSAQLRCARRAAERRSRTGSLSGAWRRRKSITGAFSTSTIWPRSGWNCRRFSTRRIGCFSSWSRRGAVTGLRIDHPDGLYLPKEYFEKLQRRCARSARPFRCRRMGAPFTWWSRKF